MTTEQMRGILPGQFSFFVIDETSNISSADGHSIIGWIKGLQSFQNCILLVSYNPNFKDNWLMVDGNAYRKVQKDNYKRYHADYRSMPIDWLGESFFKHAKMLKEANPKAYSEVYLGLPYKEPRKNVPHGTFRGKKRIAE